MTTSALQEFFKSPPKSNFKALFIGTHLGKNLLRATMSKSVPSGLKDQECERYSKKRPPIPYVPVVDDVQDSVAVLSKDTSLKISLPGESRNMEVKIPIWHSGTPESFLIHMNQAVNVCKKWGVMLGN